MPGAVTVAVVGLGDFGRRHLDVFARHPRADLVAVVNRTLAVAEEFADRYRVPRAYPSVDAMYADIAPDAVSIVSPAGSHLEHATTALRGGSSVLLEKPVVLDGRTGAELRAVASGAAGFVMPAHVLRFSPPHRHIAERVRSGAIGELRLLSFRRHRPRDHIARFPDIHPALMTTVHDIDLALWWSGAHPVEVLSAGGVGLTPGSAPASVSAEVRDDRGTIWHFETGWLLPDAAHNRDSAMLVGTRGALLLGEDASVTEIADDGSEHGIAFGGDPLGDALAAEIDAFLDHVATGTPPAVVSLPDALLGIAVAERIRDARATGEAVSR